VAACSWSISDLTWFGQVASELRRVDGVVTVVTATEFHARNDLGDWRYALGRVEAWYRCGTFTAAAALASEIAAAAERAEHQPDLDVRSPDRLHVALTTRAVDAVTDLDVHLAGVISALAAAAGAISEPRATRALEVAIDAIDIDAVRPFWKAVLDYEDAVTRPDGGIVAIVDPLRIGPAFWFQQMDQPRPQRNRIHIDVTVPHDVAAARIAGALAAGGTLLSDRAARAFWVLADPEGNEACICTWQDRN
jgi:4a-hydroxytetrahydrobiopterin dehydratase